MYFFSNKLYRERIPIKVYFLSLLTLLSYFIIFYTNLQVIALSAPLWNQKGSELNMFSDIVRSSVRGSKRSLPICERSEIKAIFLAALKRPSCAVTDLSFQRVDDLKHLEEEDGEQKLFRFPYLHYGE